MKKIFLPYEWVAVVIGSIALIVTFSNLLHLIDLSQFVRLIFQSIIFLSLGIMTMRERKVLGIFAMLCGLFLFILAWTNY
ncbi:hypothetical protein BU646_05745 [Staphylococcus chromogenes]|uniref:hypothetical protein n=1 Tax=Staphylococcus chromogenes TaxID=46126 RepID=UPI000D199070|nr:hypothetical protein [Staphylococcus chromogenes]PTG10726.1 hypothetical protein BU647_00790 [Staphylococcus chromogenes]PTG16238.1 hypothetical protein BU646_05745 [Staphylococcus chromogenes]